MVFDPSIGDVVRSGPGFLLVVFGSVLLGFAPRNRRNVSLAVAWTAAGLGLIVLNLTRLDDNLAEVGTWIATCLYLIGAGAVVLVLTTVVPLLNASSRRILTGTAAFVFGLAAVALTMVFLDRDAYLAGSGRLQTSAFSYWLSTIGSVTMGMAFQLLALSLLECLRKGVRWASPVGLACFAFGMTAALGFTFGSSVVFLAEDPRLFTAVLASLAVVGVLPVAWGIAATRGPNPRVARDVTIGFLVWILAGIFTASLAPTAFQAFGFSGIARIMSFIALTYAVFRLDVLEGSLRISTIRTGTMATVGLAVMFITAQVAQNFLSDRFGLVLGGIVAGVAVFAVFPLQRAAERAMERHHNAAAAPAEHYRRQVELAWRDGHLAANERLLLSSTREFLGITPDVALRIDDEVAKAHVQSSPGKKRRRSP